MAQHAATKRHHSHHARTLSSRWLWGRRELLALPLLFQRRVLRNMVRWTVAMGIAGMVALALTGCGLGGIAAFAFLYSLGATMLVGATFARVHPWVSLREALQRIRIAPLIAAINDRGVSDSPAAVSELLHKAAVAVSSVVVRERRILVDAVVCARLHGFAHLSLCARLSTAAAGVLTSTNLRAAMCAGS